MLGCVYVANVNVLGVYYLVQSNGQHHPLETDWTTNKINAVLRGSMIRLFAFAILLLTSALAGASENSWMFDEATDQFTDERTLQAWTSETKPVPDEYRIYEHQHESFAIGLRCGISSRGKVDRMFYFSFPRPFLFYSAPVRIRLKVGEKRLTYRGRMYRDSMEYGSASLTDSQFRDLASILSNGQEILYRVEPLSSGESNGQLLSLNGASEAIASLVQTCKPSKK